MMMTKGDVMVEVEDKLDRVIKDRNRDRRLIYPIRDIPTFDGKI